MKKTRIITPLISCLLVLVLLFTVVVSPSLKNEVYALSSEDNFESYLSGNLISDTYIEEVDEILVEKYEDYLYFDGPYIEMELTEIEEEYGGIIYDYSIDAIDYVDEEEDLFDIAAVRMIRRNISVMNELVSEDCGEITDDGEFVFYADDQYVARWLCWDLQLKWNKYSVKFDSDFTIAFSIFFMIPALITGINSFLETIRGISNREDLIIEAVMQSFFYIPTEFASQIVSYFTSDIMGYLVSAVSWAVDIALASNTVWKVFEIAYGILMPSITDCVVVLYNAIKEQRGSSFQLCWIPTWKDKWGVSIKTL